MRLLIIFAATVVFLTGCVNGFKENYQSYVNTQTTPNLELLSEGATPTLKKTSDVRRDVEQAKAQGYIVVGEASFNDELQSQDNLISQAKAVKATLVIYSAHYTDTQSIASTSYVPANSTTVSSGRYGEKRYEDVSTTSGLVPVPTVTQVRNFDQHAVFLVKSRRR